MTGSTHRARAALSAARALLALSGAGALLAGCGGSSTGASSGTSSAVSRADPVTLLPTAREVSTLIRSSQAATRYDQRLNSSTVSSAFSSRVPAAQRLASGAAEFDLAGQKDTFLYVHVFEFKSLAGASSLAAAFLKSTRLGTGQGQPSGAPGEQGQASSQPYGHHQQVSYRYAFRDQNVLAYVELDGPRNGFSQADAVRVAAILDRHIKAALH